MLEPSGDRTRSIDRPTMPEVTIVVPCFKHAHYLRECLASIVAQTYQSWNVIVVDDQSPDHEEMVRVVAKFDDPRIRIIRHEKNGGLGASRNTGIRAAETDLVLPLDADDKLEPNCLESMAPVLAADETLDCVHSDVRRFGRSTDVSEFHGPTPGGKLVRVEDTLPGAGTMMRKQFWERVGGYDESRAMRRGREDFEFYIRAFGQGCNAAHVAKPLYLYRISHSSMVTAAAPYDDEIFEYIHGKHRAIFDEEGESARFLATGYDSAALGSHRDGDLRRSLRLSIKAFKTRPSLSRAKAIARSFMSPPFYKTVRDGEIRSRIPFVGYPLRNEKRYRPFFIIGVARSGNTLFRRILTSHSALHIPPETFVLGQCIKKFRRYGKCMPWPDLVSVILAEFEFHPEYHTIDVRLAPLIEQLRDMHSGNRNLAAILNGFYRHHAKAHDAESARWGDKTPMNSLDDALVRGSAMRRIGQGVPQTLERLLKVFPDAQFLHIYRDGCDVVQSFLSGGFVTDIRDASRRWLHTIGQCHNFVRRHPEHCTELRYEDLITKPEATIREVCAFLGVEFEPQMISSEGSAQKLGDVAEWYWHGQVHDPINPANTGKGRINLLASERDLVQELLGAKLEALGYPPANAEPSSRKEATP